VKVCFVLEGGRPPRRNPVIVEAVALLTERGIKTIVRYPDEELVRLDRLRPEADLYLLKSNTELALSLAMALEGLGARIVNTAEATARAKNKVVAAAILHRAALPLPPSFVASRPMQLEAELSRGPLILKPHRGHYGAGIAIAETVAELPAADAFPDVVFGQLFLQGARRDLKLFAIGGEVFGVRKAFAPGSFLWSGHPTRLSPELEGIARRCGDAFGLQLYGLDIVETEAGPSVVDVNAFPGYRGVPDAASRLVQFILGPGRL
jgi:ribosomal protein S6--L-glutamate ligase